MTLLSYCSFCKKAQVVLLLSLFSCKILERILIKAIGCPSQQHYIVSICQKNISIKSTSNRKQTTCLTRYQMFEDQTSGNPQRLFDFLSHRSTTFRFGCSCSNSPPRPREMWKKNERSRLVDGGKHKGNRSSTNSLLCGLPEMFPCLNWPMWGKIFQRCDPRVVSLDKSDNKIYQRCGQWNMSNVQNYDIRS